MRLPARALPPKTVLVAMGIAIGGALLTAAFSEWIILTDQYLRDMANYWLIVGLGLVLLNPAFSLRCRCINGGLG